MDESNIGKFPSGSLLCVFSARKNREVKRRDSMTQEIFALMDMPIIPEIMAVINYSLVS